MYVRHTVKVGLIGFHAGGNVMVEGKKRIMETCMIFVLNNSQNGFTIIFVRACQKSRFGGE